MFPFINSRSSPEPLIQLIRYLFVWRVNGSMVWQPRCLAVEISQILGEIIADRLPTREARPWRKALAPRDEGTAREKPTSSIPRISWPMEAVLFVYPGKQTYGRGELILWELKLLGESADHGLFLETILPAVEAAGTAADSPRRRTGRGTPQNSLWGRFEIQAVYTARGKEWLPIAREGTLDLRRRPTPDQWAEGLTFDAPTKHLRERLTWLTPFDLGPVPSRAPRRREIPDNQVPTLETILEALIARVAHLLPGKSNTPDDVWRRLDEKTRSSLQTAMEQAARIPVSCHNLASGPRHWPGRWIGRQRFPFIPPDIVPYLELASILHIGRQTHFGCGTFTIA